MITSHEVLARLTGHNNGQPQQIQWSVNFTAVRHSRSGTSHAFTHVNFRPRYSFPGPPDRDGIHRLGNVRVTVEMDRRRSWFVRGQENPLLLRHEQGHFSITWLVARHLCRRLLELEFDSAVGDFSQRQIIDSLSADADEISRSAQTESTSLNGIYDGPVRGSKNADGSINVEAQNRWDQVINQAIQQEPGLSTLILFAGGNPNRW